MATCRFLSRFYVKNTPKSGMCERCCIDITAKRGICELLSQNPVGRFVLWCKITVTVRELFGINCLKITVTFSVLVVLELIR